MEYTPPNSPIEILFEDEFLLIVNKPSGLLSVPGRGKEKQDCLISRIQKKYSDALIVNRLDVSKSGLMIIARGKEVESMLSILFQKKMINKKYIAVVDGEISPSSGEIDLPLITDWPNRPKQKIDFITGKKSQTKYSVISINKEKNTTRVELTPLTGRTHQLRIHMQSLNHAILGDELYANKEVINKSGRLLLHACHLSFKHPISDEMLEFNLDDQF